MLASMLLTTPGYSTTPFLLHIPWQWRLWQNDLSILLSKPSWKLPRQRTASRAAHEHPVVIAGTTWGASSTVLLRRISTEVPGVLQASRILCPGLVPLASHVHTLDVPALANCLRMQYEPPSTNHLPSPAEESPLGSNVRQEGAMLARPEPNASVETQYKLWNTSLPAAPNTGSRTASVV